MENLRYRPTRVIIMLLFAVCVAIPAWSGTLNNIGEQHKQYEAAQKMIRLNEEMNAKKREQSALETMKIFTQQDEVRAQLDPIIRYMHNDDGNASDMPPIVKSASIANPGEYYPIPDLVAVNPNKFGNIRGIDVKADTVVSHEDGHYLQRKSGHILTKDAAEVLAQSREREFADAIKGRYDIENIVAQKVQTEGHSVNLNPPFDQYAEERSKKLLDVIPELKMPVVNPAASINYGPQMSPNKKFGGAMSARDEQDMMQMQRDVSMQQELVKKFMASGNGADKKALSNQITNLYHGVRDRAIGIEERSQADLASSLGPDESKINVSELQRHAVGEIGWTAAQLGADLAEIPGGGALLMSGRAANSLWQAHRVGTGEVGPEALRGTMPHVVQAWDSFKGSENFPSQNTVLATNSSYSDGFLRSQTSGVKMIQKNISSSAPGVIGNYGFDPATDSARILTSQMSVSHTSAGFNTPSYKASNPIPPPTPPRIRRVRP